ncbi:MAG: hypothetical protein KBF23_02205 [Agitococcus sp.]|nr:hypothetical protein [Moraxellaceae bacterium]MBP9215960.1 hypothetical protein [Agitococcus sp.]MBK7299690.1 hypothetical protein [Moraxellaceae bacterium]MBK8327193.1 hypothetical protein [Moraxellaceae bacterium]MCC6373417.1 hypothetical protein [Moraxellaceae bacterium]
MPLVFGLLVVLNAVFLAWQFFEQQNHGQNAIAVVEKQEGKTLDLLSERPDIVQNAKEVESVGIVDENKRAKAVDDRACYRIGPLLDNDMARQIKATFEKGGFDVSLSASSSGGSKYWLYIPSLATSDRATVIARELQKQGIDASVVTEAQMANAISLGTVADYDQAQALKARVAELGYRADMKTTLVTRKEQWLLVKNVYAAGEKQIERILVGSSQLERQKVDCR